MKYLKLNNKWIVVVLAFVIIAISLTAFNKDDKRNFSIAKNLDIFYTLFRELNSYYVDTTDPEKLIKTGIDNMLKSLDPYTKYISEDEMKDFKFMTTGEYGGMGAMITGDGKYVYIAEPYKGKPADLAGLKAGDKILEVNGVDATNKKPADVSKLLKGPANTTLKLKIERPGFKKPLTIELIRKNISINPVSYYGMLDDNTGIIVLDNFTAGCSKKVASALKNLKQKNNAKSIILDLRGNPGGLLDEAVKIVNLFVPKGSNVVFTKGKVKQWDQTYKATVQPVDTVIPLAVLINRGSASASEIVAGSLQDLDRAVLLGERSFGKGLVQTTRNLLYNTKLKVTTAKYYIPSGRCIQAVDYTHRNKDGSVGLVPDSLIKEFNTVGGRKVFDGGGVSPDIKTKRNIYGNLAYALVAQQTIFKYVTQFVLKHPTISESNEFEINDDIYNEFKKYVASLKDFKYESATHEELQKLIKIAKQEKYYNKSKEEFEQLESLLSLNVQKDLDVYRKEISRLLANEILKRYYYQEGALKYSLNHDKEVEKAIEILNDKKEYDGMLDGTILSHAGDKRNVIN